MRKGLYKLLSSSMTLLGAVLVFSMLPVQVQADWYLNVDAWMTQGGTDHEGNYVIIACTPNRACFKGTCSECHSGTGVGGFLTSGVLDKALDDEEEAERHQDTIFPKYEHTPSTNEVFELSVGTIRSEGGGFEFVGKDGHAYLHLPRGTRMLRMPPGDRFIFYKPR